MKSLLVLALLAGEPSYSVEETLARCAALTEDADRLACFDQLATVVAGGVPTPTIAAAPPVPAAPALPAAPSPKTADAAPAAPEPAKPERYVILRADDPKLKALEEGGFLSGFFTREEYQAKVVATKRNNMGVLFVQLDNGEIWRENRPMLRHEPEAGETVVLEPGLTGGWYAVFPAVDRKTKMRRFDIDD